MGLRSRDDLDGATCQQGHDAHHESPRTAESEGEGGEGRSAEGRGPQSGAGELRGAVETWLRENEERREDQPYLLRPGKLNQLKAARQKTLSSRGKGEALMATLTLLAAEGI